MKKRTCGASSILKRVDSVRRPGEARALSAPPSRPRVLSVRWAGLEYLTLSSVDLAACRFAGAHDLDRLRLEGDSAFALAPTNWRVTARQTIAEEHEWRTTHRTPLSAPGWSSQACALPDIADRPGARDIAAIYRDLRKGREDNKAEPDAADFYYGEMEMRRLAPPAHCVERALLSAYWAVSGYGLRASRAVATLLVVLALGTVGFATAGVADMNRVEYRPVTSALPGQPAVYQQVTVPAGRPGSARRSTRASTVPPLCCARTSPAAHRLWPGDRDRPETPRSAPARPGRPSRTRSGQTLTRRRDWWAQRHPGLHRTTAFCARVTVRYSACHISSSWCRLPSACCSPCAG